MTSIKSVAAGMLTLIALQAFTSGKGPAAAGGLLTWSQALLTAAMSSKKAGIPYGKHVDAKPAANTSTHPTPAKPGQSIPEVNPGGALPKNPTVV